MVVDVEGRGGGLGCWDGGWALGTSRRILIYEFTRSSMLVMVGDW
jgi:hypothetical protein